MSPRTTEGTGRVPVLRALSDAANRISERLLFVLMILMVLVTMAQVIFRFFFTALTWSEELTTFLLVFASLVGTAVAFKKGSHIAVTFLAEKLPSTGKKLMATLVNLLALGFFGIVTVYGIQLMRSEASQLTPAMQISMVWIYLMYPLVGVVIILHLAYNLTTIWKKEAA